MRIPGYFAQDFFQEELPSSAGQWESAGKVSKRDCWPSVFIGSAGTRTGLHVDYASSHFWMLTTEGKKDWAVFPAQMAPWVTN